MPDPNWASHAFDRFRDEARKLLSEERHRESRLRSRVAKFTLITYSVNVHQRTDGNTADPFEATTFTPHALSPAVAARVSSRFWKQHALCYCLEPSNQNGYKWLYD